MGQREPNGRRYYFTDTIACSIAKLLAKIHHFFPTNKKPVNLYFIIGFCIPFVTETNDFIVTMIYIVTEWQG